MVAGFATLHQQTGLSAVVVHARILDDADLAVAEGGDARRPAVRARVLAALKGDAKPDAVLRFVQHGHGVAPYAVGEEVILFLDPLARHPELGDLAGRVEARFVSVQEHDDKLALDAATRAPLLAAVRAYAGLAAVPDADARRDAFRDLTLRQLASPVPRLAASALGDLVLLGDALALRDTDVTALRALAADVARPVGLRAGVLSELARRGRGGGPEAWARLVRGSRGRDRVAAVRAAGSHPSPAVTGTLTPLLASEEPALREAAAVALGAPGHGAAVPALARALEQGDPRLRMAAIRGLGGVASDAARAALRQAAAQHADPATRRRARAELRALGAAGATPPDPTAGERPEPAP